MHGRSFLGFVLGLAATFLALSADAQFPRGGVASAPLAQPITTLTVQITPNGAATVNYPESTATRLGDFITPGFTQQNWRTLKNAALPDIRVFIRPDTGTSRWEYVVELGMEKDPINDTNGTIDASHIHNMVSPNGGATPAYTVRIVNDATGQPLTDYLGRTSVNVTNHWWGARFRVQSAQRPIVNNPAALVALGHWPVGSTPGTLATYDPLVASGHARTYVNPMDDAGVQKLYGTTGDREDLGVIPEAAARWMLSPNTANYEQGMRAWSEASASVPNNWRDVNTGAPFDLVGYSTSNSYGASSNGGSSWWPNPTNFLNPTGAGGSGWVPDWEHPPALAITGYLATLDPYLLEQVQFECIGINTMAAYWQLYGGQQKRVPIYDGTERALAWTLRLMGQARFATQLAESYGTLPAWFLPSSKFKTLTDDALTMMGNFVNNANPPGTVFGAVGGNAGFSTNPSNYTELFQSYYLGAVLYQFQYYGFSEWASTAAWKAKMAMGMAGANSSGWPPAAIVYDTFISVTPTVGATDWETSFANAWADLSAVGGFYRSNRNDTGTPTFTGAQITALTSDPTNGGVPIYGNSLLASAGTVVQQRANIAFANKYGLAGAAAALTRLNTFTTNAGSDSGAVQPGARWSVTP